MRDGKGVHTISDSDGCREDVAGGGEGGKDGSKHVKGTTNHQLQKFTPLGLVS